MFQPTGLESPMRAASAAPAGALTRLDAILTLQCVEDALHAPRKRAVRRGRSLLDGLEAVRADLLVGQVSVDRLDQLMDMVTEAREQTLPGLDALLDDIELRVRVELAKFGRYPAF